MPPELKTRRRQGVVKPHGAHRTPERRCQFPRAFGPALVTVQGGVLSCLAEHVGGLLEKPVDEGLVRLHKCRDHVGQAGQAAPLVSGQQFHRRGLCGQEVVGCRAHLQRQADHRIFGLSQPGKVGAIQTQIEIGDPYSLASTQGIDMPGLPLHKRRLGRQDKIEVFQVDGQRIGHGKFTQDRHGVLEVGQIHPCRKGGDDVNRRRRRRDRRS